MANEDGSIRVTFNGEIYNFRDLRRELEAKGHKFRSDADTEVVVHAYEEWGEHSVARLRGMFAFGLWDARKQRLLLARDRVGKKPLFYSGDAGKLIFASELQAVLASGVVHREIDMESIDFYLSWGYIPAPRSGFRRVKKLLPGHFLVVDARAQALDVRIEKYWSLEYLPKVEISEEEAIRELRSRLSEAVRLRLIADVPVGAFLSGGIDSSVVVGLMAQESSAPVKTFSIGFEESGFDELEHARRIARKWGTEHHEHVVNPDAVDILPELVRHLGEPFADSSAVPTYYVAKATRNDVTVALSGDGGDESFAGYQRYWANGIAERLRKVPGSQALVGLLGLVPESSDAKSTLRRIHRFAAAASEPRAQRYGYWMTYFTPSNKASLLRPNFMSEADNGAEAWLENLVTCGANLDAVDAVMQVDVHSYLPYDLLVKVDIASMIHSLEVRSPFLDPSVMEFASRLPPSLKIRGRTGKYILRKAFSDILPKENVTRPKMGFGVPVGSWIRGPLRELVHDALLSKDARILEYVRPESLRMLVEDHESARRDLTPQLWALLMLEMWHCEVVESAPATVGN